MAKRVARVRMGTLKRGHLLYFVTVAEAGQMTR